MMNILKIVCGITLIISLIGIIYGFFTTAYITMALAIICIPLFILSLGLLNMSQPKEDEIEERLKEPFTGY